MKEEGTKKEGKKDGRKEVRKYEGNKAGKEE